MNTSIIETILQVIHVVVALFLVLVVLLQQGKGGGLGAAFGGGASAQVFGGRGAGNVLTRATFISAGIFMLTSVSLAYISSSGDRALKERAKVEEASRKTKVTNTKAPAGGETPAAPADKASDTTPAEKPAEKPAEPTSTPPGSTETPAPK